MHKRTLLFLTLAVLVLGGAAWWVSRAESRTLAESDVPLFDGLEGARVDTIRVENLERDMHMKLVRGENGHWRLVDPIDAPADDAHADHLLKIALERRAAPISEAEADAKKLGLEPPRFIVELQAETPHGPVRSSVDFGALDPDGSRINVRARGRLLRTLRDIDTTITKPLDEFRSHRVMTIDPREVIEVHRRGGLVQEGASTKSDLALDALGEEGTWRATSPVSAALDPLTTSVWIQSIATLELDKFADEGSRLLGDFGLDPPEITVELATDREERKVLRLGRPGHREGAPWTGTVEGQPYVWFVQPRFVYLIGSTLESLLDRRIVRLARESIDGVRLQADGGEVRLEREGAKWRVSRRDLKDTGYTPPEPADKKRVEALLARIEGAELGGFLAGAELPADEIRAVVYVAAEGEEQGGSIGAAYEPAGGGHAVRFRRKGDTIVALADPSLLEIARTPLESLWSLQLAEINEMDQSSLVLSGTGATRVFERGSKGLWTPKGLDLEARELHDVLDPLFFLRASERLAPDEHPPLKDPVTVEFTNSFEKKTRFVIGAASDGKGGERAEVEFEGRRSVLRDQKLHQRLLAILEMK
jgi:hypothetical protein